MNSFYFVEDMLCELKALPHYTTTEIQVLDRVVHSPNITLSPAAIKHFEDEIEQLHGTLGENGVHDNKRFGSECRCCYVIHLKEE